MIKLVFYEKSKRNAVKVMNFEVSKQGLLIGRNPLALVNIPDKRVSRNHAIIFYQNGKYYIEDLGSRNGTFVNGNKISMVPLSNGDEIKIGDYIIRFYPMSVPSSHNNMLIPAIAAAVIVAIVIVALVLVKSGGNMYHYIGNNNWSNTASIKPRTAPDPQKAQVIYTEAINLFNKSLKSNALTNSDIDQVISKLEEAKRYDPTNPDILDDLSSMYILKGEIPKTIDDIKYVRKMHPDDKFSQVVSDLLTSIANGGK